MLRVACQKALCERNVQKHPRRPNPGWYTLLQQLLLRCYKISFLKHKHLLPSRMNHVSCVCTFSQFKGFMTAKRKKSRVIAVSWSNVFTLLTLPPSLSVCDPHPHCHLSGKPPHYQLSNLSSSFSITSELLFVLWPIWLLNFSNYSSVWASQSSRCMKDIFPALCSSPLPG